MLFHEFKPVVARAVAGVEGRGIGIKIFRVGNHHIVHIQFRKMESADENIRPESVGYIQYSVMGTSAEKYFPAAVFYFEELFVPEIVGHGNPVFLRGETGGTGEVFFHYSVRGIKDDTIIYFCSAFREYDSAAVFQGCVQSYVFFSVIVWLEGVSAHIHRGSFVYFQEFFQPAPVVIVAVGDNADIRFRKIDAESRGVSRKHICLAGIEKNFSVSRFDVEGKSVFAFRKGSAGPVVNQ